MSNTSYENEVTAWRRLGFWFEFAEARAVWSFRVTYEGRQNLSRAIVDYVRNPRHAEISEHEHYGPYNDLKIVTWTEPRIDSSGIWGSISDLSRLAQMVDEGVQMAQVGEVLRIGREYCPWDAFAIEICVVENESVLVPTQAHS